MTDNDTTYNGWKNRETWNASLWINNEPGTHEEARDIVRRALADYIEPFLLTAIRAHEDPAQRIADQRRGALNDAGDALREWWDELNAPDPETASPLGDAWGYAMSATDWYEIADGIAEDMPFPVVEEDEEDEER